MNRTVAFAGGLATVATTGLIVALSTAPSPAPAAPAAPIPTLQVVPDACLAALHDADRAIAGYRADVTAWSARHRSWAWRYAHAPATGIDQLEADETNCRKVAP